MLPHPELDFRRTPVTLLVAAVAVAIELVCHFDPGRRDVYYSVWKLGLLSTIWSGEVWRPFTTCLLHGSLLHAGFNVYCLVVFGRALEPFFGSFRYLLVLIVLALTSMVPSFLVSNMDTALSGQTGIVGLSGIVYGLFGIAWMGRTHRQDMASVCTEDTVRMLIVWFFICILLTYTKMMNVANVAHGLGLIVGVLAGQALFEPKHKWLWRAGAVLVTLVLLVPTFAVPGHPLYEKHMEAKARDREPRGYPRIRFRIERSRPADQPPAENPQEEPTDGTSMPSSETTDGQDRQSD